MICKFDDNGWCYAPEGMATNATSGACLNPTRCVQNLQPGKIYLSEELAEIKAQQYAKGIDPSSNIKQNKYLHEIKPGVLVDVYDVIYAWNVTNPALQHLIKKALQAGNRGHKDLETDMQDIIDSAIRAKQLEVK